MESHPSVMGKTYQDLSLPTLMQGLGQTAYSTRTTVALLNHITLENVSFRQDCTQLFKSRQINLLRFVSPPIVAGICPLMRFPYSQSRSVGEIQKGHNQVRDYRSNLNHRQNKVIPRQTRTYLDSSTAQWIQECSLPAGCRKE